MKVNSFIEEGYHLKPIEVELSLLPGLPQMQIMGLPDQHIRESSNKIRAAIKQSGYDWPQAQSILVHLKPSHIKKSSQGVEFAIAMAYLLETEQIPKRSEFEDAFFYGRLGLDGQVDCPKADFLPHQHKTIITGLGAIKEVANIFEVPHLSKVASLNRVTDQKSIRTFLPDFDFSKVAFPKTQGEILGLSILSGLNTLLAGPSGAGKSFFAESLPNFRPPPTEENKCLLIQHHREHGKNLTWYPVVQPHHTIPVISMVGGGSKIHTGELAKAHGGFLILDEMLEFHPKVLDSLREPIQSGQMRIMRHGEEVLVPAEFQLIATTNLCPCGKWIPEKSYLKTCRYSLKRCRSYSERLSGPMLDRFGLLAFVSRLQEQVIQGAEIRNRIEAGWKIIHSSGVQIPNFLIQQIEHLPLDSHRRITAIRQLMVASAVWSGRTEVTREDLEKALEFGWMNFEKLDRWEI